MNANAVQIRSACEQDLSGILATHQSAFADDEGPVIARLVAEMLDDPSAEPVFSFVAEFKDQIVGHVLFTSVAINPARDVSAQILAPLAVTREMQGQGLGTRLVNESLTQLAAAGVQLVFVLGYPDYYSRFCFVAAGERGLRAPYPIPRKHADAWMVHELRRGAIAAAAGTVKCCDALSHPQYWQA
tara:strand:- start:8403 stop:8960 length:558 start_codon:yes stop_codon:yes gene_type:complete